MAWKGIDWMRMEPVTTGWQPELNGIWSGSDHNRVIWLINCRITRAKWTAEYSSIAAHVTYTGRMAYSNYELKRIENIWLKVAHLNKRICQSRCPLVNVRLVPSKGSDNQSNILSVNICQPIQCLYGVVTYLCSRGMAPASSICLPPKRRVLTNGGRAYFHIVLANRTSAWQVSCVSKWNIAA